MNFKLINILIASILFVGSAAAQWQPQQAGTTYALKSVYFLNENTGFACGYNTVLKTTNSGVNWVNTFLQGNHNSIKFTEANIGYICSDSGKIFKTTNQGSSWNTLSSGVSSHLNNMDFINSSTGIVAGLGKTILKTTDAGNTWINTANFIWQIDLLGCKMIDADNYYVSGNESFIMRSTDGGLNWIEYTHGEVNPLFAIEFINQNTGWATGCCGMFMTTTNAGANWTYEYYLSLGFTFYTMQFLNEQTGYVTGHNGMIYRTTNGGLWWDSTVTNTDETIYSIHMLDQNTGWAVGGFGTIYKTTNGGGTGHTIGITQISNEVPREFELMQNYPNPFNPETKIKFNIPKVGFVSLKIYDVLGNELETLINSQLKEGIYEADFSAKNYPSGIYFYKMDFDGNSYTRKMIIVK
jgi:photosystem II stability/assembly factor-like uncharacterized protein